MKDKIENLNLSVSDLTYDNLDENLIQEIEEDFLITLIYKKIEKTLKLNEK